MWNRWKRGTRAVVAGVAVVLLTLGTTVTTCGCVGLAEEHREAQSVTIHDIDFRTLREGVYVGAYHGGMREWRANTVEIAVSPGRVDEIRLLESAELEVNDPDYRALAGRVLASQSLQVDVISGATLTSKAHLKAMELALERAEP